MQITKALDHGKVLILFGEYVISDVYGDNLCCSALNVVKVLLGQHGVVCVGRSEVDLEAWAAHQDSRSSPSSPRSFSSPHHEIRSAEVHESPILKTHLDNLFFAKPRALSGAVSCGR